MKRCLKNMATTKAADKPMSKRIFVAGHQGMVGASLLGAMQAETQLELVLRTRNQLDLCNQDQVKQFFNNMNFDEVYLAAAKVGGIYANSTFPAEFAYQNLTMQTNVIDAAYRSGVNKLLFLGSSCIYPRLAVQPMCESALLTGELEPSNESYAIAKIAGIKLCAAYNRQYGVDYRSVMPTNLYGPGDNFHEQDSHVIPAMMLRFHKAKVEASEEVVIWGSGEPRREFMHVDDLAAACLHVMALQKEEYISSSNNSHINVGTGVDCSIAELAEAIKKVVGFGGRIVFDETKPDGVPRKLLDVSRLSRLGWQAQISLERGLQQTYQWLLRNEASLRGAS